MIHTKGYLYSGTVDYLATSQPALAYTYLLLVVGWMVPSNFIALAHYLILIEYRYKLFPWPTSSQN